jgi:hypothetical protein
VTSNAFTRVISKVFTYVTWDFEMTKRVTVDIYLSTYHAFLE